MSVAQVRARTSEALRPADTEMTLVPEPGVKTEVIKQVIHLQS